MVQITWWYAERNNIEDLILIYIFLSITLREGGKFTMNTAKRCLLKTLSSYALRARAFYIVWNCNSSLSLFLILHFLFTNFGRQPFSKETIHPSLYLICIINRLHDANEPLAKDILRLCPDLHVRIQQKTKGWLP